MPAPVLKVENLPCSRSDESAKKVSTPCTPMFVLLPLMAMPNTLSEALLVKSVTSIGAEYCSEPAGVPFGSYSASTRPALPPEFASPNTTRRRSPPAATKLVSGNDSDSTPRSLIAATLPLVGAEASCATAPSTVRDCTQIAVDGLLPG